MISVVVPCYNAAETLNDQVERLLPQLDAHGGELVLIDNNSTDSTPQLLTELGALQNVVVDSATERQSAAHARNVGVRIATGDLLLFCDADDLVDEQWVANMTEALRTHEVVTGLLEIDELNTETQRRGRGQSAEPASFYGIFPLAHGGNMAVTRTAWDAIGPLDEHLVAGEDIEWSMRAHLAGYSVVRAADAIVHYRYRATAKALWKQGLAYGTFRPEVARRVHLSLGHRISRIAGVRSWAWLAVHAASIVNSERRAQLAWVAGNRLGHIRGSIRSRFMLI